MRKEKLLKKCKRKVIAATLSLAMLAAVPGDFSMSVLADDVTMVKYGDKKYELHTSGDYQYILVANDAVIVKYTGKSSAVAIPSTIDGYPVTVIGYCENYAGAFEGNSSMQSVVIPSSIEKIDAEAFRYCTGLQQVSVGSGTKVIGDFAFDGCTYMQGIKFTGNALETIGLGAFWGDEALDGVVLPESVKKIGEEAFKNCTSLSSFVIPDSVTELGGAVFAGCTSLEEVVIGDGVTLIPHKNRRYNHALGTGSSSDDDGFFENCSALKTVTIGIGVAEIGIDAFANTAVEGIVIPNNVVKIAQGAFYNCDQLTSIDVGNGAKEIGAYSFLGCDRLESVTIGKKVNVIGQEAFRWCEKLKEIVIPSNVRELGAAAFAGCTSMTNVVIGNGVTSLKSRDRSWNNSLGLGAVSYVDGTFEGCVSLAAVTIGNGVKELGTDTFSGTALVELNIPDNVQKVESGVCYDCNSLKKVTIGRGVNSIGGHAFYHCGNLIDVEIGKGVISIGEEAFRQCTSLEELNLPSNITSVGSAFCAGNTSLKKVIVGNGVTSLKSKDRSWNNPLGLGAVTYVDGTFEGCTMLVDVTLGSGLASIGLETFSNTKVSTLFIPRKVTEISKGAFHNTGVDHLYFAGAAPTFGDNLFGEGTAPVMHYISGKSGFDQKVYEYEEYEPITVKFETNNELSTIVVDQIMSADGGYVIEPIAPAAENYLFLGWYGDKDCTKEWDFMNDKVTADTTLYAKWVETSKAVPVQTKISDVYETTDKTTTVYWQAVPGASEYNIYKDGVKVGTAKDETCQYKITGLEPDTSYEITVTAINSVGESEPSLIKVVQTAVESTEEPDDTEKPDDTQQPDKEQTDKEILLGDVDSNNTVNLADAQMALKAALKITKLNSVAVTKADVNRDNEVNLKDAQMILKYALKIINKF